MMKKLRNETLINCTLWLIGSVLLGTLLLMLVYLLPEGLLRARVVESSDIFYTEGVYPQLVQRYKGSQLDNETDAIMLLSAIDEDAERNVLERAMAVPHVYIAGENSGCRTLVANVWENQQESGKSDYGRYWHGYLVWLKPLLVIFSYADIRYLNMFLQFFLLTWVLVLMTGGGKKVYCTFWSRHIIGKPSGNSYVATVFQYLLYSADIIYHHSKKT